MKSCPECGADHGGFTLKPALDLFEGEDIDVAQLLMNLETAALVCEGKPLPLIKPEDLYTAAAVVRETTFTCVGCGKVFAKEHGEQENMGPGGWHCFTAECEEANS